MSKISSDCRKFLSEKLFVLVIDIFGVAESLLKNALFEKTSLVFVEIRSNI